jgi:hypothetical protein
MNMSTANYVKPLAIVFAFALSANVAQANVLTFDDINGSSSCPGCFGLIPNGYGGLAWNNMYYMGGVPGSGYDTGLVSGSFTAFNGFANMAVTSGSTLFDFTGAYFTGAWNDGLNINVKGYKGGVLLYDQTVIASAVAPTWFQFDYTNIDSLQFSSSGGTSHWPSGGGQQFAMDNFTYTVVPVPAAVWLLGSGLLGLAGMGRKRSA